MNQFKTHNIFQRFPWGDGQKSFFHNPEKNALPDGYEPGSEGSIRGRKQ